MRRFGRALGAALIVVAAVGVGAAPAPSRAAGEAYYTFVLYGNGSGAVRTLTGAGGAYDNQIDCRMVEGTVDPREICGQVFYPTVGGTRYYYKVEPAANSCVQMTGSCSFGYQAYFELTPGADITKNITFNHAFWLLTVNSSGVGQGTGKVTSSDGFFDCASSCNHTYPGGTVVHLTAVPNQFAHFESWTGACAGQDATCDLTMLGGESTTANFAFGTVETPGPTPTATPLVTPAASTKASTTPTIKPSSTPKATGSAAQSAGATGDPGTSVGPSTDLGSLAPSAGVTLGPPSPADSAGSSGAAPTTGTVDPAGAGGGSDLTPIILAILGAGLFIAMAIGFVGFRMSRGRGTGAPPPA